MQEEPLDVLIVGAGLSGVGAGAHLARNCPGKTYVVLESRAAIGGTWDLFRYPGIRSDSDMFTLGYSFKPWTGEKSIADGDSIRRYIEETAHEYGVDKNIRFRRKVVAATFSSDLALWTLEVEDADTGVRTRVRGKFLFLCTGYYDYDQGHTPAFEGQTSFRGDVVHPQFWSDAVDYEGKKVVVIGSGATAVTLIPSLAEKAAHVTMLQRSPTYVVSAPDRDPLVGIFRRRLAPEAAYAATRAKNILLSSALYQFCRRFPEQAKNLLVGEVKKQVGATLDVDRHFVPRYAPWDQRVCLVPNADLFQAIRDGRASVVTDTIDRFVPEGIRLASGKVLEADLVVTATGLRLKFAGGVRIEVDGRLVDLTQSLTYKGMMCSDVPNLAFSIGYTNASWTLKSDLTSEYVCRVLEYMDREGYAICCPRNGDASVVPEPLLDLTSGYIQRAVDQLPRQGSKRPWKLYQNYFLDRIALHRAPVVDGVLEYARVAA